MLTEERYATILRILKEKQAVTVPELTRALCTSESTIRRDLTALHKRGMLYKVYGGATSIDSNYTAMEEDMPTKSSRCTEEKIAIARRAASLVTRKDFVYIDAGSTTLHMVDSAGTPGRLRDKRAAPCLATVPQGLQGLPARWPPQGCHRGRHRHRSPA